MLNKKGLKFTIASLIFGFAFNCPAGYLSADTNSEELVAYRGEVKITLDLQDASLRDTLKMLSVQSGLNFVASEAVAERKLTLYLDNVPLSDALDKVFKVNNLSYELDPESNIFIVKDWGKPSIDLDTRVYFLKYTRVTNSRLNEGLSSASSSSANSSSSSSSSSSTSAPSSGSSASSTTTANGLKDVLETVLSEYGKIIEDPATNSLIITDMRSKFPIIEQLISKLDIAIPQVMIEVEILDVDKSEVDKLGFKFTGTDWLKYTGPNLGSNFPLSRSTLSQGLFGHGGSTPSVWDMRGLTFALDFLSTRKTTKFLARPKLFVLNNETAELKLSANEAIGSSTTTQGQGSASTSSATAERAETGVVLNLTPQISLATGEVTMILQPTVKETVDSKISLGTQVLKDVEERSVKSTIRVKDGATVIIGGLIRQKNPLTQTKAHFLGDIPVLGLFFRHRNTEGNSNREILVFITPRIMKSSARVAMAGGDGNPFTAPKTLGERKQDDFISSGARRETMSRTLGAYESYK